MTNQNLTRLTALLLCSFVATPHAVAQEEASATEATQSKPERPFRYTIQLDPLTAALGFLHLQIEHAPSPHFSYYVGPHMRLYDSLLTREHEPYKGLGVEVGVRYFFRDQAPEGLWLGTRGVLAAQWTPLQEATEPAGYVSALGGYTWISDDHGFVLSGGLGVQYIDYQIAGLGPKGIYPALHTAFGTAF